MDQFIFGALAKTCDGLTEVDSQRSIFKSLWSFINIGSSCMCKNTQIHI